MIQRSKRLQLQAILGIAGLALLPWLFARCAKNAGGAPKAPGINVEVDSIGLTVESTVGSVNGAMNDVEQVPSYALHKPGFLDHFESSAYATTCGVSRFSPAVGSASCTGTVGNETVTSNFIGCTAGHSDELVLSGTITLTFDSSTTCNTWISATSGLPTSGSVTRTGAVTRVNPNGSKVLVTSDSSQNYQNIAVGGGVKTSFGAGTRSIDILGLHRTRTGPNGATVYDHSVASVAPIVVSGTKAAGNRTISSGTVRVDHNLAKYSVATSLAGLSWTSGCCYPVAGLLTFNVTGSITGNMTADFNTGTCGQVKVTDNSGATSTLSLTACE